MQLISEEYVRLNKELHEEKESFGMSGSRHLQKVLDLTKVLKTNDILDYGCGKSTLARNLPFTIREYDPAIVKHHALPTSADIVVCTDVLEHIEPDCLDAVLTHLASLTKKLGYFTACTCKAKKVLSDGRNAHLIVESARWWVEKMFDHFEVINFSKQDTEVLMIVEPKGLPKVTEAVDHE